MAMEEIEQEAKNKVASLPSELPQGKNRFCCAVFEDKKMVIGVVVLMLLIFLFIPFGGKSVWERIMEFGRGKAVNLLPNSGFEEGAGDDPVGWETRTGRLD